jgi:hypothetical protein
MQVVVGGCVCSSAAMPVSRRAKRRRRDQQRCEKGQALEGPPCASLCSCSCVPWPCPALPCLALLYSALVACEPLAKKPKEARNRGTGTGTAATRQRGEERERNRKATRQKKKDKKVDEEERAQGRARRGRLSPASKCTLRADLFFFFLNAGKSPTRPTTPCSKY